LIFGPDPSSSRGQICQGGNDTANVVVTLTSDIPNGTWTLRFEAIGFGGIVATADTIINVTGSEVLPLEVTATASPTSGDAPLTVSFTGGATGGVPPYSFLWDFGDGTTSTAQNPVHTYTSGGRFKAVLTVTDSSGNDDSDSVTIKVSAVPLEATATADPTSGGAPLEVSFTGEVTGGTPPYDFVWSFGDGTTSTEQNPVHTYTDPGRYSVTLTVTDSSSPVQTDVDSLSIRVR